MKEKEKKERPVEEFPTVNLPHIDAPIGDPAVPNRAFTEMKLGRDIDTLSEEEKADLYLGRDSYF